MTDIEINEAVARKLGWSYEADGGVWYRGPGYYENGTKDRTTETSWYAIPGIWGRWRGRVEVWKIFVYLMEDFTPSKRGKP